ncbi:MULTISPECIES: glycoside hydrolase family 130 protein [unclassified Mucilaginibacter]|uniref:glycoside hydrolase family 130 protein n=1 Tax=unclassified Mucilaginibacter TaxID=2617802 RepID=UPI002AC8AA7F|nr:MULTISPECIES: glycoside hydrolase family 130 protein [unclassified Mucilaginibacter]MEB0262252.1 glycoside hydrolase family 130 protein [Mucilaginibacter sp. 10I4]MEB0277125.1 glycoside hydrolase family 130 protein [Mucilaginibacter sp. 10B2]MEB0301429.1 glycoside hydrolase family 130 protein [Mucilaginibacter sp. 5C4]WPX25225.1 glycoside hydrolase family 130 protein [Mucilaginibacter sp. 5C4]
MADIAKRFPQNPLLSPKDLKATTEGLHIACLLNPGVFRFDGKVWLLVRVAERPEQSEVKVSFPILTATGETTIMEIALDDSDLIATDARVVRYKGIDYLTTLSHLRLLCSDDGVKFYEPEGYGRLFGSGPLQTFGIEDCRVTRLENKYYLTFTAVSDSGVGVGMRTTTDWKNFQTYGMILPPHNKDVAIFEEKINGKFYTLHRPSSVDIGGNYIWIAESPDGEHWGNHKCIVKTREGMWDSGRVGAGAAPIKTEKGWLEIYHGATKAHRYCLGAVLLDLNDPSKVIARTTDPIMEPTEAYETTGFFGHVVFTNGHVVDGDNITIYYGAADEFVCGAKFSIMEILAAMGV